VGSPVSPQPVSVRIVYSLKADDIIVLGVAHLHRKPESWRTRLKKGRR
jgi:hypothetical protein